jgi:formate dehydrogenase beta subunit
LLIDIMKAGHENYPDVRLNGRAIVIGGPNLTSGMIQRCKDLGAREVTVLLRQEASGTLDGKDVRFNAGVTRLFGEGDSLVSVELTHLDSGETEIVDAAHVIFASGRVPELIFAPVREDDAETTNERQTDDSALPWQAVPPYKQPSRSHETGLMADGDVLTDFSAAIKAIASGRRAAASIHKSIYGISLDVPVNVVTPETPVQNVDRVFHVPTASRRIMPLATAEEVGLGHELEMGFDASAAKAEADRCLQCGLICYLRQDADEDRKAMANG